MTPTLPLLGAAIGAFALVPAAQAQIQQISSVGDTIAGVGTVTRHDNVHINDFGTWLISADTNNADTNADQVLYTNGHVLLLREGQAMTAPGGATLNSVDSMWLNNLGHRSHNHFLSGTGGTNNDSGIYFDDVLVLQEGTVSTNPAYGGPTPYIGFFDTKMNDWNTMLIMASVDDPTIATTVDRSLVAFEIGVGGVLVNEVVLAKEGDILPGQTEAVTDFGTGPHATAFNNAGQYLFVADLTGDTNTDGVVYRGTTIVAQEGQPSSIPGRNWRVLGTSTRLDLNFAGDWVLTAMLDGDAATDAVIATANGAVAQEGMPLAAPFDAFNYVSFGSGPVYIADTGDVLYYAQWNSPDNATNKGLFLGSKMIVQQGVTQVNGLTVTTLRGIQDGYYMSGSGRYILFEAVLSNNVEGMFMIDRSGSVESIAGCTPSASSLAVTSGGPAIGSQVVFEASTVAYPVALPVLVLAFNGLDIGGGCGLPLPGFGGELLIDPSSIIVSAVMPTFGGAPVSTPVFIPFMSGLIGFSFHAQAVMVDATLASPIPYDLTNALKITLGV